MASTSLQLAEKGVWRRARPRITPALHVALRALVRGDRLVADPYTGSLHLRDAGFAVLPKQRRTLVDAGGATAPLPTLPPFNEPACDRVITECGVAAPDRGSPK
jgi:hypothetical protein